MLFGIFGTDTETLQKHRKRIKKWNDHALKEVQLPDGALFFDNPWAGSGIAHDLWTHSGGTHGVLVYGNLWFGTSGSSLAKSVWDAWQQKGTECFQDLDGDFILVLWDAKTRTRFIVRDPLGILPVYHQSQKDACFFSSDLSLLANVLDASINFSVVSQYLTFNYNPSTKSIFNGIDKLRSGHFLKMSENEIRIHPYWNVEFKTSNLDEESYVNGLRDALSAAVQKRIPQKGDVGTFLSGGLDSSSITSLLHQKNVNPLYTFSFRCKGESFDESPFAAKVSDTFQTRHHVVEYSPQSVKLIEDMVQYMDEPFCDVGINVATYLLSLAAKDKVNTLFTGDGGDELFAGHPVYLADMSAAHLKYIPGFLKSIVFSMGRRLKDSDKKKDLRVKIKRFSESYSYPAALGTHRWRAYYHPSDLNQLFHPELTNEIHSQQIFDDMIAFNEEGKHPDFLSQSLYSDYHTVVQFYLRRMDFARKQNLWPRFPMLDKNVVEFCATIPSKLKIPSMSETKYIEKKTIEPWLPYEIVYRKDKLGHSIPLKNWMRYNHEVQSLMLELLSDRHVQQTGIFEASHIQKMIQEHLSKKVNHSHRLWALMVFILWLEKHKR